MQPSLLCVPQATTNWPGRFGGCFRISLMDSKRFWGFAPTYVMCILCKQGPVKVMSQLYMGRPGNGSSCHIIYRKRGEKGALQDYGAVNMFEMPILSCSCPLSLPFSLCAPGYSM